MAKGSHAPKPKPLSAKAKAFVIEFCKDRNATAAAERAGYSAKSARQQGSNLYADERVKAAIDKFYEQYAMGAGEAIALLADWGRGSIQRFLKVGQDGTLEFNLSHPEAKQHLHLIKEMTQTTVTIAMGDAERTERRTTVKLHDAKDAVHKILQIHGRYAPQKFDHTNDGGKFEPGSNIYVPDNGR